VPHRARGPLARGFHARAGRQAHVRASVFASTLMIVSGIRASTSNGPAKSRFVISGKMIIPIRNGGAGRAAGVLMGSFSGVVEALARARDQRATGSPNEPNGWACNSRKARAHKLAKATRSLIERCRRLKIYEVGWVVVRDGAQCDILFEREIRRMRLLSQHRADIPYEVSSAVQSR
jgi:hypothetical protein